MTAEIDSIVGYVRSTGVRHRITSTTGGNHAVTSLHYKGCAVDFAGPVPSRNSPALLAIFKAFEPVEGQLAELIYSGGTYSIKDGKRVPRYAVSGHWDHVHVALRPGRRIIFAAPAALTRVEPMFDPALDLEPIVADLACPTGGVWLLAASGAIYTFGGAPYLGGPNGKPYWGTRTAARLVLVDGKYRVVATTGETYGPGF